MAKSITNGNDPDDLNSWSLKSAKFGYWQQIHSNRTKTARRPSDCDVAHSCIYGFIGLHYGLRETWCQISSDETKFTTNQAMDRSRVVRRFEMETTMPRLGHRGRSVAQSLKSTSLACDITIDGKKDAATRPSAERAVRIAPTRHWRMFQLRLIWCNSCHDVPSWGTHRNPRIGGNAFIQPRR